MEIIDSIKQTIDDIRQRVKHNVGIISENQDAIKQMLKHSKAEEYAGQYEMYSNKNKELLSENNDLINVQLTLVNFLDKYKSTAILKANTPISDIYSVTDQQEIFALTIKGVVKFDNKHPHYTDTLFIDKLIKYYEGKEDYEQCQHLSRLRNQVSS